MQDLPSSYAPVLIPTLCRYKHLEKCISSLAANTGADKTDLYIALDFPLKESHRAGYEQIREYLSTLRGFRNVNIIERKTNYGALYNLYQASRDLFTRYDRLIVTEDDNVFSPNFLSFVNKGLDRFQDDQSVFAINGYTPFYNLIHGENNALRMGKGFSAWGYGIWKDREERFLKNNTKQYYKRAVYSPKALCKVFRAGLLYVDDLITLSKTATPRPTDRPRSVYMTLEQLTVVKPVLSQVRNIGWDGSGEHCNTPIRQFHEQPIDIASDFSFTGDDWEAYVENAAIVNRESLFRANKVYILLRLIKRWTLFWQ